MRNSYEKTDIEISDIKYEKRNFDLTGFIVTIIFSAFLSFTIASLYI